MSSDSDSGFIGSILELLFLAFLVWMVCSPKKEPFIELTVDDYKIELFGKYFVKVENIENSEGTIYDSLNSIRESIAISIDSAEEIDSVNIISTVNDSTTGDSSIGKPIVPTSENDYETIEEFEYSNENEFEFN